MSHWRLLGLIQLGRDPRVDPELSGEIIYLIWLGNDSGPAKRNWKVLLGRTFKMPA